MYAHMYVHSYVHIHTISYKNTFSVKKVQPSKVELYLEVNTWTDWRQQGLIKKSGSESRGQEEAAYMQVIRPMRPLQWVIYMHGSSKFLKCCSPHSCVMYTPVYSHVQWQICMDFLLHVRKTCVLFKLWLICTV